MDDVNIIMMIAAQAQSSPGWRMAGISANAADIDMPETIVVPMVVASNSSADDIVTYAIFEVLEDYEQLEAVGLMSSIEDLAGYTTINADVMFDLSVLNVAITEGYIYFRVARVRIKAVNCSIKGFVSLRKISEAPFFNVLKNCSIWMFPTKAFII